MKKDERKVIKDKVELRYGMLSSYLTEQAKRVWAVSEATAIGRGGNAIVSEVTGISRVTINRKKTEGKQHPDRDAQFHYINRIVKKFQGQWNYRIIFQT